MKPTNLNILFQQLIYNFAHLVTTIPQSKEEFINTVKAAYSAENPKTVMFIQSIKRSEFDTIRLSADRNNLLFNQ